MATVPKYSAVLICPVTETAVEDGGGGGDDDDDVVVVVGIRDGLTALHTSLLISLLSF